MAQIVAVTGSVGKTSTKEMLRVALSASGETHASAASFNNHWGVPLTLARMPRETAFGVFEIGMNHAGEITPLVGMVQPACGDHHHHRRKPSRQFQLARRDRRCQGRDLHRRRAGRPCRDQPRHALLRQARRRGAGRGITQHRLLRQACRKPMCGSSGLALHADCCCITASVMGETVIYKLGLPGEHMAVNSLAVLAAAKLDRRRSGPRRAGAGRGRSPPRAAACASRLAHAGRRAAADRRELQRQSGLGARGAGAAGATPSRARAAGASRCWATCWSWASTGPELHAGLLEPMDAAKVDVLYAAGPLMANLWDTRCPATGAGPMPKLPTAFAMPLLAGLRPAMW